MPGAPASPGAPGAPGEAGDAAPVGARLLALVEVMDRLRTGCPWDAGQTHASLAPYLLEETYEALEALDSGDPAAFRDELGDVLLQVVFHARIAAERDDGTGYTIDDVADGIVAKLTRRHPHVFADTRVSGPEEVKSNWDAIKAAEREAKTGGPASILDGIPLAQPALSLATALQRRADRAGAPASLQDFSVTKTAPADSTEQPPAAQVSEIGAQLFALAARARAAGLDPELELRTAARAFRARVQAWEQPGRPPQTD
jgi:XTP/dITP diphosphohydrolase